jgi:hypothetical protein
MPALPRLTSAAAVVTWANQLVNALELQMRRLIANSAISTVPQVGQTATGTNLATSFQISSTLTVFSTVASGTGASVPTAIGWGLLVNNGANALTLYGSLSGGTINGGASVSVAPGNQVVWSTSSATVANAH